MYVQVYILNSDNESWHINCRSINQLIDELRNEVARKKFSNRFNDGYQYDSSRVRLFFHGKELKNGYTFYDYNIKINDVIVAIINEGKHYEQPKKLLECTKVVKELKEQVNRNDKQEKFINEDEYYKVGDHVDGNHPETGAWFEGKIIKITSNKLYYIKFENINLREDLIQMKITQFRPQSATKISFGNINENDLVLVNYNVETKSSKELGYWYDLKVEKKLPNKKLLIGTLLIGDNNDGTSARTLIKSTKIWRIDEIYKIETNKKRELRSTHDEVLVHFGAKNRRALAPECKKCQDKVNIRCKECSCHECGGKNAPEKQIICDECESIYHIWCLPDPIDDVPIDDWYCNECKNNDQKIIDENGEKQLQVRRKKLNRVGVKEWGRGMACMGRTQICKSVSKYHFGPIPNVSVGTWWRFRFQASEAGIHTPLVAGIHGKENSGAFSVVFSCSYDDDIDLGDEFYYTASGGKDLNNKSRVGGPQVKDQELKRCNRALAVNCYAEFNDEKGANAGLDWKKGKPVRVLRSGNGRGAAKKSIYLPKIGVRYDGIYKVVKYWPQTGQSGFLVWRFLMRRDDPSPAPWTKEGKLMAKKLGLSLIYPPGWDQYNGSKRTRKIDEDILRRQQKRKKHSNVNISKSLINLITCDKVNSHLWHQLMTYDCQPNEFIMKLKEMLKCVCCLDLVKNPITTPCRHNICKECISSSFEAGVNLCPICRSKLNRAKLTVNETLNKIVKMIS